MKIAIISTHFWPIPYRNHSGDYFYALLAQTLDEMGHDVTFFAPDGSYVPLNGKQLTMPCSMGASNPSPQECENKCFDMYADILRNQDIVHDFSLTKQIIERLYNEGYKNTISNPLSGCWYYPNPRRNFIVFSENMKQRGLRGATDYENSPTPNVAGPNQPPILDAHIVYLGIDTDLYAPNYHKKNYFLWLGRWNPVRGYRLAIQLAKETGIELVIAGEHPDREVCMYQRSCCFEALDLAKDCPNIHFEWLPADPHHHEAKIKLIQNTKALLFPVQFQEPFGLMQPEALSCGTPVIGTNFGSVPEVIEHGKTGYVVENNVEAFKVAINNIDYINPIVCREQALKRFDRHVMAKNYIKEYRKIIAGESW